MDEPCMPRWRNCAQSSDDEILAINAIEHGLDPLSCGAAEVRELISTLELCHHKAARWVGNIVEAIGAGGTDKGLGTREPGRLHDAELVWQAAADALAVWCAGCPAASLQGTVGTVPASRLLARIGARTSPKEWQVQRVIDRIRSLIHWPPPTDDPAAEFTWILLSDASDGNEFRDACPERYAEHEDHWRDTARTIIRDTHDGHSAPLSLGLAIDMLWPCHWDFVGNLEVVLGAVGGNLSPERPFSACGRNIGRLPDREHYDLVCRSLQTFAESSQADGGTDPEVLGPLGSPLSTPRRKYAHIRALLHRPCRHLTPLRYGKGTSAVAKDQQGRASPPSIGARTCVGEH